MVYTPKNVRQLRRETGSNLKKIAGELALIGTEITPPQITQVFNVDGERTDSYTPTGALDKPFLLIQDAIDTANALADPANVLINVAPGEYAGDFDIGPKITTIRGSGLNSTMFTGHITAGDRMHMLEEFRIKSTGSLTITDNLVVRNAHIQGPVTVGVGGFLDARKVLIVTGADIVPLTVGGDGGVLFGSFITTSGVASAIEHTLGTLVVFHSYVQNNSVALKALNSIGGVCGVIDTTVINAGVIGGAINLDNDGVAINRNSIDGVVHTGDIVCGAAHTVIEGANNLGIGAITGTNLIYRPASRLANDSAIAGDTIKDALDAIDGRLIAGGL
jgi:hypothetical protein